MLKLIATKVRQPYVRKFGGLKKKLPPKLELRRLGEIKIFKIAFYESTISDGGITQMGLYGAIHQSYSHVSVGVPKPAFWGGSQWTDKA